MANKIPTNVSFQRLTNKPLDPSSIANTFNEAEHYARNSVLSYEGQIIHVNDARIEEDINNNINIYEKDYYIDNNKNIVPICELSYKSIGMLIDALYKLNEGTMTNEIFNNLRDELTDSYEKPEVPTEEGGDGEEKPAYYKRPWDTSLYNDHQIVVRISQPSPYIRNNNHNQYGTEELANIFVGKNPDDTSNYPVNYITETISVMHNGVLEHYNVYTLEELPKRVSFEGGDRLFLELIHMCDTSEIENMMYMFLNCTSLKILDLSSWDVSNVKSMYGMFRNCNSLTSLNLDGWDTGQVTSMEFMFYDCSSLKNINVNHFDLSSVTRDYYYSHSGITGMFKGCSSLIELDLSNWNISTALGAGEMFRDCKSLISLNLSNWDTNKFEDIGYMFAGCTLLTTLDLSSFSTPSGSEIYMSSTFSGCSSLTSLVLGPIIPSEAIQYQGVFNNTYMLELNNIDMSRCSEEAKNILTNAYNNRSLY
jgi:surface protein